MNSPTKDDNNTFESIFLTRFKGRRIKVPDYQRAYSWDSKQVELFIGDLSGLVDRGGYYFGHFIVEDNHHAVELVDGQQRLTTAVMFLRVCQIKTLNPSPQHLFDLLNRFETVGYDQTALEKIMDKSPVWLESQGDVEPKDDDMIQALNLEKKSFTYSQRRLALAVWHFHRAFEKGTLQASRIPEYIQMLSNALCSCHIAKDKTVAVNIFEMHNTRGVPLKLIEVVKAKLMKAVYDEGGPLRDDNIKRIQSEFALIHAYEERLVVSSFRGRMSIKEILTHHLRVIDDAEKQSGALMNHPARDASADDLIRYINERISATYALALAREFRRSVQFLCDALPQWDQSERLVGDVMILHPGLSCEFFLLVCRRLGSADGEADGRVSTATLSLWERLLFTHDFHTRYHNLKGTRDDFPGLFSKFDRQETSIAQEIEMKVREGFRKDKTDGDLQKVVRDDFLIGKSWFLSSAFNGWRNKVLYALYKYEIDHEADIRRVMKDSVSVEHILPQEWDWKWLEEEDCPAKQFESPEEREKHRRERGPEVAAFINGLGNLLLVTREQNSALGNEHPAKKNYTHICQGGSYAEHEGRREDWKASEKWKELIRERGERIFDFILNTMLK